VGIKITTPPDERGKYTAPSGQRPISRVANRRAEEPIRTGRGVIRIAERTADLLDTPETVKDWDDEELRRGRRKDKDGRFRGRDPVVIPTVVFNELRRREWHKVEKILVECAADGARELAKIITNPNTEPKDKIRAIDLLFNRTMGKETTRIDATLTVSQAPFIDAFNGALVSLELPAGDDDIIDAEVIEDSELEFE
jgi:hypothetical protein